jgi:hypothetical protein
MLKSNSSNLSINLCWAPLATRCSVMYLRLCYSMRDKLNTTLLCFLYASNRQLTFNALLFMIFYLCYFLCCNMVAKFYC